MGHRSDYLSDKDKSQALHGTTREGLLVLAGPPGNGKTAMAHGIANLAGKPIHNLKVSETSTNSAIEAGFKDALKKGAILFIDEADAVIRGRDDKVTQAFLETFNRYQRESPVRVILATNSFAEMDSAIQSRSYVFNVANPDKDLKLKIFEKALLSQGLKESAYKQLLETESGKLSELLDAHNFSGRDIGSIVQDLKMVAEMRIHSQLLAKGGDTSEPEKVLEQDELRIRLEDLELAIKEFVENTKDAKQTSIKSKISDMASVFS